MADKDSPKRKPHHGDRPWRNVDGTVRGHKSYGGKTINSTVSLYQGDHELLDYLVEFLGSNRSDAIRAAIRSFAAVCQAIERKR